MKIIEISYVTKEVRTEKDLTKEKLFELVKDDLYDYYDDFDNIIEHPREHLIMFLSEITANGTYTTVDNEFIISEDEKEEFIEYAIPHLKHFIEHFYDDEKEEELEKLKDRESILEWLEWVTTDSREGEIGYSLSPEEILDAILENGRNENKDRS